MYHSLQPSYLSYKANSGYGNNVQSQQYSNNNSFLSEQQQVSVGQSPQYKGSTQHDLSFKRIAAASVQGRQSSLLKWISGSSGINIFLFACSNVR